MPLPLGHIAIGIATHEISNGEREDLPWWRILVFVTILSNLPDLDVLAGLLLKGNGWFFHRGPTHSIAFAVFAGILASRASHLWSFIPKMGFWTGFSVTFSHVAIDICKGDPVASLFWPFEVAKVGGQIGWGSTLGSIFFDAHNDADVIVAGMLVFFLVRWWRRTTGLPGFCMKTLFPWPSVNALAGRPSLGFRSSKQP